MVLAVVPALAASRALALVVLAVLRTMITMVGVLWTPPGGSRRLDRTRSRTELLAPPSSGGGSGSTGGGGSAPVMLVRGAASRQRAHSQRHLHHGSAAALAELQTQGAPNAGIITTLEF